MKTVGILSLFMFQLKEFQIKDDNRCVKSLCSENCFKK